jgi:Ku protein
MARPLWKGSISFGLVTVPIGLVSAIEAREELAFNLLHKEDSSRIVLKRFCKEEDVEVPWSDVVKGYQYAKDQYVVMTDDDFEKARVPATQTFEIRRFVAASEVEDLYFDYPTTSSRKAGAPPSPMRYSAMPWPRLERSASARSYCGNASISARSSRLGRRSC